MTYDNTKSHRNAALRLWDAYLEKTKGGARGGGGGQIDFPASLFKVKAKIFLKTLIKNFD